MRRSELILSIIKANGGEIQGKTTMQKLSYFCSLKPIVTDLLVFRPHYYGPYSAQVDFELDKLTMLGFLSETSRATINSRIIHDFSLRSEGVKISESVARQYADEYERIRAIVSTCKDQVGLNSTTLSIQLPESVHIHQRIA